MLSLPVSLRFMMTTKMLTVIPLVLEAEQQHAGYWKPNSHKGLSIDRICQN
jgi:hypothetical protein